MSKSRWLFAGILMFIALACTNLDTEQSKAWDPLPLVDPFIGTGAHGHTYPGATVPFGMVQLSPDNGTGGWDWCSGYHYSDSILIGFSHLHLSGTGIGDLADVRLMPTTKSVDLTQAIRQRADVAYASRYKHSEETASPGYYQVKLQDSGIEVALTASSRVGMQAYTFPEGSSRSVVLDLAYAINWDRTLRSSIEMVGDTMLTG